MQNTGEVLFKVFFASFYISKLAMLLIVGLVTFILGILVGRPKKTGYFQGSDRDHDAPDDDIIHPSTKNKSNTLSDDDREYIN